MDLRRPSLRATIALLTACGDDGGRTNLTSATATSAATPATGEPTTGAAAMTTTLRWTKLNRLKLHGPRHRQPGDPMAATADEAWRQLTAIHADRIKQKTVVAPRVLLPNRYISKMKPVQQRLDAVLAELERDEPPRDLDVSKELVRALVIWDDLTDNSESLADRWDGWSHARALVDFWAGSRGLAFCLEVLASPPQFSVSSDCDHPMTEYINILEPPDDDGWELHSGLNKVCHPLWWAARVWVSSLSDDAFVRERDAVKVLLSQWNDGSSEGWCMCCRLAYVLSRDPSIAEAVKAQRQEPRTGAEVDALVRLYPSLANAESVMALLAEAFPDRVRHAFNLSFDIVDAYDIAAAPILRRMLGHSAKQYETRERAALEFVERATSTAAAAPAATTTKKTAKVAAKKPAKVATKKPAKVATKKTAKAATKKPAKVATKKTAKVATKKTAKVATKKTAKGR